MGTTTLAQFLHDSDQTARAFATAAGVHYSRISRYLAGKSAPGRTAALKIERATGGVVRAESWDGDVQARKPKLARVVARRGRRPSRHLPDRV